MTTSTSPYEDTQSDGRYLLSGSSLSPAFVSKLRSFTHLEHGWDGGEAEEVSQSVAENVEAVARAALAVAAEPIVAPCPDGSVLLRWTSKSGIAVEVFVGAGEPQSLAVIEDGGVREVQVSGTAHLLDFLGREVGMVAANTT